MKRSVFLIAIILVIGISSGTHAEVDWDEISNFKAASPVLDVAISFDGQYVFILSPGKVQIFSKNGILEGSLDVDSAMSNIDVTGYTKARIENQIVLNNRQTGEIQIISYDFIIPIDTRGSPFLGMENAPVSVVIFSDFQ